MEWGSDIDREPLYEATSDGYDLTFEQVMVLLIGNINRGWFEG